jgi:hypothetical protein
MRPAVWVGLLVVLSTSICSARTIQIPGEYAKARYVTNAGKRFEASRVSVHGDSMECIVKVARVKKDKSTKEVGSGADPSGQGRTTVEVANLKYLEVQTGTKAGTYALIGGGSALLGALLGVAQAEADPYTEVRDDANVPLIVGVITAVGAGIGALVGSGSPVYTPVRKNGEWVEGLVIGAARPQKGDRELRVGLSLAF